MQKGGPSGGAQDGSEPRIELIVIMHKKVGRSGGAGRGGGGGGGGGDQGGCEPLIEVIVKMKKRKS